MTKTRITIITLLVGLLLTSGLAFKAQAKDLSDQVIGVKTTKVYHLPDSPHLKRAKEKNKITFESPEKAEKAGFRPAKRGFSPNKKKSK